MTRTQRAVLALLDDAPSFLSAQDVHARLRATGQPAGLTSVYRALQALADAGEVDVLRDEGEALYRRCGSSTHHHHLVCRQCGTAVEVAAPQLERWVAEVAGAHGFVATEHLLEIRGLCARCAGR